MKFPVTLAFVFAAGTALVGADYYVEFREPVGAGPSSSTQPVMITYLYECKSEPAGKFAFVATESLCTLVTTHEHKFDIYVNCNFFSVYNPNSRGHVIRLEDRGILSLQTWNLGFLKGAIDHPNFAVPDEDDIDYFQNEITEIWPITGFSPHLISNIAFYYAQNNLVAYSRNFGMANELFNGFVTFLKRLSGKYASIHKENATNQYLFTEAMKIGLRKMIDPCSILHSDFRQFTKNYCTVYCNFLNIAALHFDAASSLGPWLNGGNCVGVVCMCTRVVINALAGCNSSPMQQVNNGLRMRLNL